MFRQQLKLYTQRMVCARAREVVRACVAEVLRPAKFRRELMGGACHEGAAVARGRLHSLRSTRAYCRGVECGGEKERGRGEGVLLRP